MKLVRAYRDFRALFLGISEKKVSGNFFQLRPAVGCKTVKKKKNFNGRFFRVVFLFLVLKSVEKVNSFRCCDQRRRKI